MHRSRIGVVLIDHPTATYDASAAFWTGARGGDRGPAGDPGDDEPYEVLDSLPGGVKLDLQRTGPGTPPRIHLDIETDDVAAEVDRLLALGAQTVQERDGYTILADPGGLLFCVVPIQTGSDFETHATTWS
jgi:hypothetical protein